MHKQPGLRNTFRKSGATRLHIEIWKETQVTLEAHAAKFDTMPKYRKQSSVEGSLSLCLSRNTQADITHTCLTNASIQLQTQSFMKGAWQSLEDDVNAMASLGYPASEPRFLPRANATEKRMCTNLFNCISYSQ